VCTFNIRWAIDSRTGIAVSDPLGLTAQAVTVLTEKGDKKLIAKISEYMEEYDTKTLVVGLPKNMNGSLGERANLTLAFAEKLKKRLDAEVIMQDERLSSAFAHRTLEEMGVSGKKRTGKVDSIAAVFILQGYLDAHRDEMKG